MRVAVAGTPGTGKTAAVSRLEGTIDLECLHLNAVIREHGFHRGRDSDRDTLIADLGALEGWLEGREDVLFESHLAHHLPADRVVVLRCRPAELERRLRDRGESAASAHENAQSEALDVILAEAVDRHGPDRVYELDTTARTVADVADVIAAVVAGERDPRIGIVDFTDSIDDPG